MPPLAALPGLSTPITCRISKRRSPYGTDSWGRKNVIDRATIRTRARRQAGGVLLLCFASGRDLSSLIARLPCSVGRESGSESPALDCLDRNRRVVGHSVGTDLLDPIAGDEFPWRKGNSTPDQSRGPSGKGLSAKPKFRHIMVPPQFPSSSSD